MPHMQTGTSFRKPLPPAETMFCILKAIKEHQQSYLY